MTVTATPVLASRLSLSPKQVRSVVESDAPVNLWTGAIRSGKTISSLLRWLMFVAQAPEGGELVMVGRTRQSVARNAFASLQNRSLFGEVSRHVTYTPGADSGVILGRRVWVFGASDVRAEMTMRGMTVAGAYGDETTLWSEELWVTLLGRMSVPGAQLFATTNPDNPAHWFKTGAVDRVPLLGWQHFHFLMEDNATLTHEYVERMKREYVGLYYRRFILGDWVQAEGAIYPMWDPLRHVIPAADVPELSQVVAVGIDYGTTNPTRGYLLGIGHDARMTPRLYVVAEWAPDTGGTDAAQSQSFRTWLAVQAARGWHPQWVFIDPAAASFKVQLYQDGVGNAANGHNAVVPGIRTVQSLLATGQLLVSDACTHLIDQLPGYVWDPKATKRGEDAPLKVKDHEADALRYAVHSSRALWRDQVPLTVAEAAAPGADDDVEAA